MSEVVAEYEGKSETVDAVSIFEESPTMKNKEIAIKAVKNDTSLSTAGSDLLEQIQTLFMKGFSSKIIPSVYEDLKREAKYLSDLNQISGLYMAQRLIIIRNKELYKNDGYTDFRSFIESELTLSRSTVYNYIDIIENFTASNEIDSNMEKLGSNRSKLVPFIPLLKSDKLTEKQKSKIRTNVISDIEIRTFRELTQVAKELKLEYGLTKIREDKSSKISLVTTLFSMFESIKLLSHPKANDAFLIVLDQFEMNKKISTEELELLSTEFNKFELSED